MTPQKRFVALAMNLISVYYFEVKYFSILPKSGRVFTSSNLLNFSGLDSGSFFAAATNFCAVVAMELQGTTLIVNELVALVNQTVDRLVELGGVESADGLKRQLAEFAVALGDKILVQGKNL